MDLVVITKRKGTVCRFRLNALVVAAAVSACAGLFAFGSAVGYARGSSETIADVETAPPPDAMSALVDNQRRRLERLEIKEQRSLTALTARLGQLQAEVTRLNALASRVVDVAGLDPDEFSFAGEAAVGGPEEAAAIAPDWQALVGDLNDVAAAFQFEHDRLDAFEQLLRERDLNIETMPSGRPVAEGWISSGYGRRVDPISGARAWHRGIDFAGRRGSDVLAVASGVVTWSGKRYGYGEMVEIKHGNGYLTRYAHNRKNLVEVGDRVERDQPIALLGSTGRSTGPHVHFEVLHHGKVVNPWSFIKRNAPVRAKAGGSKTPAKG